MENMCEMSLLAQHLGVFDSKFSHEERCYSDSSRLTFFHVGQTNQFCPKLTFSSCAKVDFKKDIWLGQKSIEG